MPYTEDDASRERNRHTRPNRACAASLGSRARWAAAAAIVLGAGCATPAKKTARQTDGYADNIQPVTHEPTPATAPGTAEANDPLTALEPIDWETALQRRINVEAVTPAPASKAAAARGIAPDFDPGDLRAQAMIEEAVDTLRGIDPFRDAEALDPAPDIAAPETQAVRAYVQGRLDETRGRRRKAAAQFQASSKLSPASAAPWRSIARLYETQGDAVNAAAASFQAARRDTGDSVSTAKAAWAALRTNNTETAAALYARLWDNLESLPPRLRFGTTTGFGTALGELGYGRAAAMLLKKAAEEASAVARTPTPAAMRIGANPGAIWERVGDLERRLGRYAEADAAYSRAPNALLKRCDALLCAGRPAKAAATILEALGNQPASIDARTNALIRQLATDHPAMAALIRGGLRTIIDDATPSVAALVRGRAVRAIAGTTTDEIAVQMLTQRVLETPSDQDAANELFAAHERMNGTDAVVAAAVRLAAETPLDGEAILRYAHRRIGDDVEVLNAMHNMDLGPENGRALTVAKAAAVRRLGFPAQAHAILKPIADEHPNDTAVVIAAAACLAEMGDAANALRHVRTLPEEHGTPVAVAKAVALARLDATDEALTILRETLDAENLRADYYAVGADAAIAANEPQLAETWAKRALKADPAHTPAIRTLLGLYNASGPLPNERALRQVHRALRAADPGGEIERTISVKEMLARGNHAGAAAELRNIAAENPESDALDALVAIEKRRGNTDEIETWMREQLSQQRGRGPISRSLAGLLIEQERAEEAIDVAAATPTGAVGLTVPLLQRGETEAAAEALRRAAKDGVSPGQALLAQHAAGAVLYFSRQQPRRAPDDPAMAPWNNAARAAVELLNVADGAADTRIGGAWNSLGRASRAGLLARAGAPVDQVLAMAAAGGDNQKNQTEPETTAMWALTLAGRTSDTLRCYERVAQHKDAMPQSAIEALLLAPRYAAAIDDAETLDAMDVRLFVDAIKNAHERGITAAVWASMHETVPPKYAQNDGAAAGLAIMLAFVFEKLGENDHTIWLYEEALRYAPGDPQILNNLGYVLAVQGEELQRAETLLDQALAMDQSDQNVLDSLGYARLKRGIINDGVDQSGEPKPGAVTLLRKAVEAAGDGTPGVVLDHLGDALWAAGERDEAAEIWRRALDRAAEEAQANKDSGGVSSRELTETIKRLRTKVHAVQNDQEPPAETITAPRTTTGEPAAR